MVEIKNSFGKREHFRLTWMLLVLSVIGCGGNGVVPIKPQFLLDGEPLSDASVTFIRIAGEQGRAAFGITDDEGIAHLTTYEPLDGVLPGNYAVLVLKAPENAMTYEDVEVDPNDIESLMKLSSSRGVSPQRGKRRVRTVISKVYGDFSTTPLKCEVTDGSGDLVFELTSKS